MPPRRRQPFLAAAKLAGVLLGLLVPVAAAADELPARAFASSRVAAIEELEQQQGRFILPNGAILDLVVTSTQMINGQTVSSMELSTAGLAGIRSSVAGLAAARGLSANIQNSMDNAVIRNLHSLTLDYARPSIERQAIQGSIRSLQDTLTFVGSR